MGTGVGDRTSYNIARTSDEELRVNNLQINKGLDTFYM
jgi:hypothetical protein